MCGIIGYIGHREIISTLLTGLHRLEYRGYDSAGIGIISRDGEKAHINIIKTAGKINDLEKIIRNKINDPAFKKCVLGVGHTRWATHGIPNDINAHPHLDCKGEIAVVHNGIIENYASLKLALQHKGHRFVSETDTEVIAHLIEECYKGDFRLAVIEALQKLQGTYGIIAISSKHPDVMIAARKGSPIVVGLCDRETFIASDLSAIVAYTKQVIFLDDGDIIEVSPNNTEIISLSNIPVTRIPTSIDWDIEAIEKGGYEHFMLKEIHEQPQAVANTIRGRLLPNEGTVKLSGMQMQPVEMARVERICIAACGTSYYAGMLGKYFFEDFASIPTDVFQAAEFHDRNPIILRDTCLIAISQSGETADTLYAVREAHRKGAIVLGITNVVGSTIAREAGRGVYLHAGPEISVASTKAFSCQVTVLAMMAVAFGRTKRLSAVEGAKIVNTIQQLPSKIEETLQREDVVKKIAEKYADIKDCFYIGRSYMYPAALEGALKLKEISYIHAEAYHAAELKHGPIALLYKETPVIACVPESYGKMKTLSNIQECRARGAPVIAICTEGDSTVQKYVDDFITVPETPEFIAPIPVVVIAQLFAYYIAKIRGCPIDQPRNLAKSVTVE